MKVMLMIDQLFWVLWDEVSTFKAVVFHRWDFIFKMALCAHVFHFPLGLNNHVCLKMIQKILDEYSSNPLKADQKMFVQFEEYVDCILIQQIYTYIHRERE